MADQIVNRLKALFEKTFQNAHVDIDPPSPTGRIGGTIVWQGFEGRDQLDRQNEVWAIIDKNFNDDEKRNIILIMTLTPDELSTIQGEEAL